MATAGARAQKPVGSAAWISTEKENVSQLVDQEMEEAEYPVSHEMDWLNEHMAEIINNNQLCVATTEFYAFAMLPCYTNCSIAILQRLSRHRGSYEVRRLAPRGNGTLRNLEW